MITVKEGNELSYMILFAEDRTAYSDMCVRTAMNEGKVYIAYIDEQSAGYICIEDRTSHGMLSYAYTKPAFRRMGVMKELVKTAVKNSALRVESAVIRSGEKSDIAAHALVSCGFRVFNERMVYSCNGAEFWDKWNEFMRTRGNDLIATLERQGCRTVSFAEAGEDALHEIYDSDKSEYDNRLIYKAYFDDPERRMSLSESMVTFRDGKPVSYTIVLRPDSTSAVFRNLSTARDTIGGGVILMPIAAAVGALQKNGCKRVSYSMDIGNNAPNKFREKVLSVATTSSKRIENYVYIKQDMEV